MEKALDQGQPKSVITVSVTPTQLRTIADRIEAEARQTQGNGREVFYSMTRTIELMFDPRVEVHPHHHEIATNGRQQS